MWLLQFVMAKSPTAFLTIHLTPRRFLDVPLIVHLGIGGQESIVTHVEVVNYALKSYATDDVDAKATPGIELSEKNPNQTAVKFAKDLENIALDCGNAFSEHRSNSIFVKGLILNMLVELNTLLRECKHRED